MKVIIKGRHMQLTPALKEYVEQKLRNAIVRIFDKPACKMVIELSDLGHLGKPSNKTCKVTLSMPKAKVIVISETDDNMYKAIDLAHDRLLVRVNQERHRVMNMGQRRKMALAERHQIALANFTAPMELWEKEVVQYEHSVKSHI